MKIVRSLTEPPAEAAEVAAATAVAEEADEVPSEVGAAAAVEGGGGGGAVPPSVEDVVDEVEACVEAAEVVLARSKAILIAKYLHRCSTRALDVVLM